MGDAPKSLQVSGLLLLALAVMEDSGHTADSARRLPRGLGHHALKATRDIWRLCTLIAN